MTRLAILHTIPATVHPLKTLGAEPLPGAAVVNFVGDPALARNGANLSETIRDRFLSSPRPVMERVKMVLKE